MNRETSGILCVLAAAVGLTATATPVGVPLSAVARPLDQVAIPIERAVVAESALTKRSYEAVRRSALSGASEEERLEATRQIVEQDVLVKIIRGDASERVRREAFQRLVDGDAIFRMIVKPGEAGVRDVRLDAVDTIAELDCVKIFTGEKCPDATLREAARARLGGVFGIVRDWTSDGAPEVARATARRSKGI